MHNATVTFHGFTKTTTISCDKDTCEEVAPISQISLGTFDIEYRLMDSTEQERMDKAKQERMVRVNQERQKVCALHCDPDFASRSSCGAAPRGIFDCQSSASAIGPRAPPVGIR